MEYLLVFFVLSSTAFCESSAYNADREATPLIYFTVPDGSRRFSFNLDMNDVGAVVGVPGIPSHLPEAEPILPGHTLIRPTLGMLKSAIKFPHRELDDGAGVNGNLNNLGLNFVKRAPDSKVNLFQTCIFTNSNITWDGRNERIMYSGFRRSDSLLDDQMDEDVQDSFERKVMLSEGRPALYRRSHSDDRFVSDEKPTWWRRKLIQSEGRPSLYRKSQSNDKFKSDKEPSWWRRSGNSRGHRVSGPTRRNLADYIMVMPLKKSRPEKPSYALTNLVLDLDDDPRKAEDAISERLQTISEPVKPKNRNQLLLYLANDKNGPVHLTDLFKADNSLFTL